MNVILLTGNCTKDLEVRITPNGKTVVTGSIAVKRDRKNQNGEYETDFFNFKALGPLGSLMADHVRKGDKFGIKGTLQNNKWEKDGKTQYFTEVLVDGFDFPNKAKQDNGGIGAPTSNTADPFANSGQIDIDDSDLPF